MGRKTVKIPSVEITDIEIFLLLEAIKKRYGYDFSRYAKASLKRRIENYTKNNRYSHISNCIGDLIYDEEKFLDFIHNLSVHVTEMFRNPPFFRFFRENVISILKTYPFINIWVAGCASGEEAYSLAILLDEEKLLSRCKIYATDICPTILKQASEGIFSCQSFRQYTKNYQMAGGKHFFSDYYVTQRDFGIITSKIREAINFMPHNLVAEQSFIQAHLVFCKNVMIYFDKSLQANVLQLLAQSLVPNGFLCLGDKETVQYSVAEKYFSSFNEKHHIFRRNAIVISD